MFRSKVYFTVVVTVILLSLNPSNYVKAVEEDDNVEEENANVGKGKGFGESVAWKNLDDGLSEAKEEKKPLMLIIHKPWCGACAALKPKFASADEISDLSKHFVMVNSEDDEPQDNSYAPDGAYYPRILFLNSDGDVLTNVINEGGNPEYKYYYSDPEMIIQSMKAVMKLLEIGPKDEL